jgi:hypothetical protein
MLLAPIQITPPYAAVLGSKSVITTTGMVTFGAKERLCKYNSASAPLLVLL